MSSLADGDVPLLLSIVLQLPNASWISLLIGMEEDLVVVVVASGSYKQSITELLRQSKYNKTIRTSELDASCADRRPWRPGAWVSKNSLRRLSACKMKVVYAVDMKESDSRLYNQRKLSLIFSRE